MRGCPGAASHSGGPEPQTVTFHLHFHSAPPLGGDRTAKLSLFIYIFSRTPPRRAAGLRRCPGAASQSGLPSWEGRIPKVNEK